MSATDVGAVKASPLVEEPIMQTVTSIGLDIAKSVFQVRRCVRQGAHAPQAEAPVCAGILPEATAVPGWD
jgi:hypothetical protein